MLHKLITFMRHIRPAARSLGIEITDSSIKAVEMTVNHNTNAIIHSYESEQLPVQAVDDGRVKEMFSVIRSLQVLIAKLNPKSKNVHMVVPSQSIMVRFLKFPDIPLKDLEKLVDFEVKHNIHLPFEKPVYDFVKLNGEEKTQIKRKLEKKDMAAFSLKKGSVDDWLGQAAIKEDNRGFGGKQDLLFGAAVESDSEAQSEEKLQCDVMLVAAPRELIDEYMQIAQSAGLKLKSLEIKALSLYRFVHETQIVNPRGTILVVDVNPRASDVSIFHDGQLKITRNLPIVFEDEKKGYGQEKLSEMDALFAHFTNNTNTTAQNAGNDLAHELERLINFYRYTLNNREQVFEHVLLAGDVLSLPELSAALQEKLGIPVSLFDSQQITNAAAPKQLLFSEYAAAIGLAMRGTK